MQQLVRPAALDPPHVVGSRRRLLVARPAADDDGCTGLDHLADGETDRGSGWAAQARVRGASPAIRSGAARAGYCGGVRPPTTRPRRRRKTRRRGSVCPSGDRQDRASSGRASRSRRFRRGPAAGSGRDRPSRGGACVGAARRSYSSRGPAPRPGCACSSSAEIPPDWLALICAAKNQLRRRAGPEMAPERLQWSLCPGTVAVVHDRACGHLRLPPAACAFPCRPCVAQRPDAWPQSEQTKPFGRSRSTRYFAHASLPGERTSKSWCDMARSVLQRDDSAGTLHEQIAAASLHRTRCAASGRKGIRLAKEIPVVIAERSCPSTSRASEQVRRCSRDAASCRRPPGSERTASGSHTDIRNVDRMRAHGVGSGR